MLTTKEILLKNYTCKYYIDILILIYYFRRLIEDIMSECGDAILRIFHSNNLTYSSGMNFENLMDIIQKKNDPESIKVLNMV